nr:beta-galactosidase [Chloroflexota bacterium]
GQPYWVSEFGGFKWVLPEDRDKQAETWGYGGSPTSEEDFYERFQAVCDVLLDNPMMFGYCYTQLTDVFPELNGIYTFDRRSKFDAARLNAIQTRRAAIEG